MHSLRLSKCLLIPNFTLCRSAMIKKCVYLPSMTYKKAYLSFPYAQVAIRQ